MLACACMRSKAWLATRVSCRQARMPGPAQARHSQRLQAMLVAAPVFYAHTLSVHVIWRNNSVCILEVVILLILRNQRACIRSMDWRFRTRVTPARSPWRAHVACIPRLRQRQSFLRMLLSQKSKASIITSPSAYCIPLSHGG